MNNLDLTKRLYIIIIRYYLLWYLTWDPRVNFETVISYINVSIAPKMT